MRISHSIAEARVALAGAPRPVGFVPTMGALHAGHEELFRRARAECATLVGSIFVNPMQFGPKEDYARYPRDLDADARRLTPHGVDLLFAPAAAAVYPDGFVTRVTIGPPAEGFEGAVRPGHFDGVCTVVLKLLNIVRPDRLYLGRKDAQQLAVLTRMVRDLDLTAEIVPVETVREADGLAMSSRNVYLSREDRQRAPRIRAALMRGREAWDRGERDPARIAGLARDPTLLYDYLACVDPATFRPARPGAEALLIAAVRFGSTRLLDNCRLPVAGP